MLLLYYNPTIKNYYLRYYKHLLPGYKVGYTNQYDHVVVKVLVIQDGELVDVKDVDKYLLSRYLTRKPSLKKRLINALIRLLNKFE